MIGMNQHELLNCEERAAETGKRHLSTFSEMGPCRRVVTAQGFPHFTFSVVAVGMKNNKNVQQWNVTLVEVV
jgi:hypothetical protein